MIDAIRADAAQVLRDGRARLVLGYAARGDRRVAAFVAEADQAGSLVYDDACTLNLAAYLVKAEVRAAMPVAMVAPPPVMRSLVLLAAESQLKEGDVLVLAVGPDAYHGVLDLAGTAQVLRDKYADVSPKPEIVERIKQLAALPAEERAAFWAAEFAKCTRCYACRAACPGCYCTRCIVEKNVPQWISTAAAEHGNYAWNVIRAFHLAGRCTQCGACEDACPQGIPLMLLNVLLAEAVAEDFSFRPGFNVEAKPVVGSWQPEDKEKEDFIR